jgi:hypothetical protein
MLANAHALGIKAALEAREKNTGAPPEILLDLRSSTQH